MSIAIIGNGGQSKEVKSYFDKIGIDYRVFVSDDYFQNENNTFKLSELDVKRYEVLICIADVTGKQKIVNSLPKDTKYFTFIHPTAQIYTDHPIGDGSIICPNVIISANVKIGTHVLINYNTTVGHDTVIGNFSTINPNSAISGNCGIGNSVFIGSKTSIREKIHIIDNTIIGMGSVVVKNISKSSTYAGVPVKELTNE